LQVFQAKASALKAAYIHGEFTNIHKTAGLVDGTAIACRPLENAAVVHISFLTGLAGVPLPVAPYKRSFTSSITERLLSWWSSVR